MSSAAVPRKYAFHISEVMALILGIAIALTLPWESAVRLFWLQAPGTDGFYDYGLQIAQELLGKAALGLVPVVLVQSAVRKQPVHPAAFLLACVGLPWLVEGIRDLFMLRWMALHYGPWAADIGRLPVSVVDEWERTVCTRLLYLGINVAVAIVAGLVLGLGRKRLAPWVRSLLLMLVWTGLYTPNLRDAWWAVVWNPLLLSIQPNGGAVWDFLGEVIYDAPTMFLFALLVVPAVLGLRGRRDRRTWLDFAGLVFWALVFLGETARRVLLVFRSLGAVELRYLQVSTTTLVLAVLLGLAVNWAFGPIWSRWLGMGYDKESESSRVIE